MDIIFRLSKFLKNYKKDLVLIFFLLIAGIILELLPPLFQKYIIDGLLDNNQIDGLQWVLAGLIGVYAFQQIIAVGDNYYRHKLGGKFIYDFRVRLYEYLQKLSLSFFDKTSTGELMSRITNDVNALEHFVTHAAAFIVIDIMRLAGALILLFVLNWKLALFVCIPIPILAISLRMFNKRIRPVYKKMRARLGDINAKLQDNISGIQIIQAFGQEERELEKFSVESENYYQAVVKGIRYWSSFFPAMTFVSLSGNAIVLGVGAYMVMQNNLTIGTLVAFLSYLNFLYAPIRRIIDIDNIIQEAIAAAERIFELLDEKPDIKEIENPINLENVKGKIVFENLTFRYDSGGEVLKKVNFVMKPGEVVALVGPSGAGKTSLANLICRFYDPLDGSIFIDQQDIRDIEIASLRKQIAVVLQDTFLFNSTIKDNLTFGKPDATEEEMIAAAKAAFAHDFILALPDGYDTEIGERGVRLSGGQKQRIALARAILIDPKILILDEATSSVDAEAEFLIQKALEAVLEGRTALIIAHRLSTIQNADKIISIEDGSIQEMGDHHELIEKGGLYSQLYKRQISQDSSNS